jgi:hypothetical protein
VHNPIVAMLGSRCKRSGTETRCPRNVNRSPTALIHQAATVRAELK